MLGEDARGLIEYLRKNVGRYAKSTDGKGDLEFTDEEKQIHAWPVVQLFLGADEEDRLGGLNRIVDVMVDAMSEQASNGDGTILNGSKGGQNGAHSVKRRRA